MEPLPDYSARHLQREYAEAYQRKFQRSFTRRLSARREHKLVERALKAALERVETDSPLLLDYPCGAGRFAPLFASQVASYIAGDHSPHMVDLTCTVLEDAGLGDRIAGRAVGDAREMDLEDQSVDLAACMRLLHHFTERADRVRILSELARVSRGPLVTSFLDGDSFKQRRYARRIARTGKPSRRVLQSREDFAAEAREAGWRVIDSWPLSSLFSGQRVALLDHA
jgi:ubiquinone/menaquinone biosynthesis C-methylase UbiE